MISQFAIDDIESMQEAGLKPTPADIVRLNALGLKIERSADAGDLFALPRVSYLGDVIFREPTVGHGIWMDQVLSKVKADDLATATAVKAFALSRQYNELPDAADIRACSKAIRKYCDKVLVRFTLMQIVVAVTYAMYGSDAVEREFPAPAENTKSKYDPDVARSIYIGRLMETISMSLGVSVRDACSLTLSELERLQYLGLQYRGLDPAKSARSNAEANYFRTLAEIKSRLTKEKEAK